MKDVVIVAAARTPIGSFGRSLKDVMASDLVTMTLEELIKRSGIDKEDVDEIIMGHCIQRTDEFNVARLSALKAGFPVKVTGMTINRACSSAMQAIATGASMIKLDEADIVIAGGVESMSTVPYVLKTVRWGQRLQDGIMTDSLWEGLTDPFTKELMGQTAENLAERYNITRQEQDELALLSQQRAVKAIKEGKFKEETFPVIIPQKKGEPIIFDTDEHPRDGLTMEDLAKLPPAFKKGGTVTAGNSSGINDGAAGVIIMSRQKAEEMGIKPMAKIVGWAVAGVEPSYMGYGPVPAVRKLLEKTGLKLEDMELIEVNEAFAAQYLVVEKQLGLNRQITNVNGSGISLGHPVGATGARIVVTLLHEMKRRDLRWGLATLCVGGGMGMAMIIEREEARR